MHRDVVQLLRDSDIERYTLLFIHLLQLIKSIIDRLRQKKLSPKSIDDHI